MRFINTNLLDVGSCNEVVSVIVSEIYMVNHSLKHTEWRSSARGSEKMGDHCLDEPPKIGLKLLLDHEFPMQSKQIIRPSAHQVIDLMPLTAR